MKPAGYLLAWIKPLSTDRCIAAFVGEGATACAKRDFPGRAPATELCPSLEQARHWIEQQAAALELPVKWVSEIPQTPPGMV